MAGSFRGGLAQYRPRPEPSDDREFRYVVHLDVKSNPGTAVIASRSWIKTKHTLQVNYLCMRDQGRGPGTSFAGADAAPVTVDMAAEGLKGRHILALPSD